MKIWGGAICPILFEARQKRFILNQDNPYPTHFWFFRIERSRVKHNADAKFGWYRYDTRFAILVYDDSMELVRYNVFMARILVRHAKDGKLYLYDVLRTKNAIEGTEAGGFIRVSSFRNKNVYLILYRAEKI